MPLHSPLPLLGLPSPSQLSAQVPLPQQRLPDCPTKDTPPISFLIPDPHNCTFPFLPLDGLIVYPSLTAAGLSFWGLAPRGRGRMLQAHLVSPLPHVVLGVWSDRASLAIAGRPGRSAEGLRSSRGQQGAGMRSGKARRVCGVTVRPVGCVRRPPHVGGSGVIRLERGFFMPGCGAWTLSCWLGVRGGKIVLNWSERGPAWWWEIANAGRPRSSEDTVVIGARLFLVPLEAPHPSALWPRVPPPSAVTGQPLSSLGLAWHAEAHAGRIPLTAQVPVSCLIV